MVRPRLRAAVLSVSPRTPPQSLCIFCLLRGGDGVASVEKGNVAAMRIPGYAPHSKSSSSYYKLCGLSSVHSACCSGRIRGRRGRPNTPICALAQMYMRTPLPPIPPKPSLAEGVNYLYPLLALQALSTHWTFYFTSFVKILNESCEAALARFSPHPPMCAERGPEWYGLRPYHSGRTPREVRRGGPMQGMSRCTAHFPPFEPRVGSAPYGLFKADGSDRSAS